MIALLIILFLCSSNYLISISNALVSLLPPALTNHPQVLRALKGVNFKETGCYLPPSKRLVRVDNPNHRMNCFPFIESHESDFKYGDATVSYASNFDVPFYLRRDNPNIKSIFIVRRPISRLESHFRYSLGVMRTLGYDTVDKAVAYALRGSSRLHPLRDDAVQLLKELEGVESSTGLTGIDALSLNDCLAGLWTLFFRFHQCSLLWQRHTGNDNLDILHQKNKISLYVSKFFAPAATAAKTRQDRVTSLIIKTSLYFPGACPFSYSLTFFVLLHVILLQSLPTGAEHWGRRTSFSWKMNI